MSHALDQFKKSYEDFAKYNFELTTNLSITHMSLMMQLNQERGACDFSKSPWIELDTKTLADFKAYTIYAKINTMLLPFTYPGIDFGAECIPLEQLRFPRKLNPMQLSQSFDFIKDIAENTLKETINNRTAFEIILDFLKSCVNFFISIVTFGQKQNFFESNTFHLEQITRLQQEMHTFFEELSNDEKTMGLEQTNFHKEKGIQLF